MVRGCVRDASTYTVHVCMKHMAMLLEGQDSVIRVLSLWLSTVCVLWLPYQGACLFAVTVTFSIPETRNKVGSVLWITLLLQILWSWCIILSYTVLYFLLKLFFIHYFFTNFINMPFKDLNCAVFKYCTLLLFVQDSGWMALDRAEVSRRVAQATSNSKYCK